jgi:hypothetical protein
VQGANTWSEVLKEGVLFPERPLELSEKLSFFGVAGVENYS